MYNKVQKAKKKDMNLAKNNSIDVLNSKDVSDDSLEKGFLNQERTRS